MVILYNLYGRGGKQWFISQQIVCGVTRIGLVFLKNTTKLILIATWTVFIKHQSWEGNKVCYSSEEDKACFIIRSLIFCNKPLGIKHIKMVEPLKKFKTTVVHFSFQHFFLPTIFRDSFRNDLRSDLHSK